MPLRCRLQQRISIMSFDLRQLGYAIAAADHGSFYRAARALGVEQSKLSRNIAKLEQAVGARIFDRTRAGVTMTPAGSVFIRGARPMAASADRLVATMRAAGQGRAGVLVLGHHSSISAGNLRSTMINWRETHPDVRVECVEADRGVLVARLDAREIDAAVLMGAVHLDGYRCEAIWSERLFAALPVAHRLAASDVILWTDLRREIILLPIAAPGPEMRDILLGRLSAPGAEPDIRMHQSSRETILNCLDGDGAVSIICEGSTGARYPGVVYRPIHGEHGPALTAYSGYWRDDNQNPALRRFLSFVRARYALLFDIVADPVR